MKNNWSIMQFWNDTISIANKKEAQPREVLWTSEIGRSYYDTYLSMMGVEPTNEVSDTIRRKMEAGNFYENVVRWVFQRTGILKEAQGKVRLEENGLLPIYGRFDILAGCDNNWKKRREEIDKFFNHIKEIDFDFPFLEQVKELSYSLIDNLSKQYPEGLEDKLYEIKSINSIAFWKGDEPISTPYEHHIYQGTFYQKYNTIGVKKLSFLYIDRDTMSVSELPNIVKDEVLEKMNEWHKQMTYFYVNKIEPPKPELIIFDKKKNQWTFNWEIDRSYYKNRILGDKKMEDILEEIRQRNKQLKETRLMEDAKKGKNTYGVKKYKRAIELLNKGMSVSEVAKKTGIREELLN